MNNRELEKVLEDYLEHNSLEDFLELHNITPIEIIEILWSEGLLDEELLDRMIYHRMHKVVEEVTINITNEFLSKLLTTASIDEDEISFNQFVLVKDITLERGSLRVDVEICEPLYH